MFVRAKPVPGTPRRSVQLVESVRDGKKVSQVIVRHIGVARNDAEEAQLRKVAEFIRANAENDRRPALFSPETMAQLAIDARSRKRQKLGVDLGDTQHVQTAVTGIHEVFGQIFQDLGFHLVLRASRYRASSLALLHTVMAKVANPGGSKRGDVLCLEEEFGVSVPLQKIYRMMDQLDERRIDRIQSLAAEAARSLLPQPVSVLLFDCTTLAFETQEEDGLRQKGYSKDGKHRDSQVLLALLVTREGLPVGYEVVSGATHESRSLLPALRSALRRYGTERIVVVADRGMLSDGNLEAVRGMGCGYVVGAKLRGRSLTKDMKERVLDAGAYRPLRGGGGRLVAEFEYKGRRMIVRWCPKRAEKDAHDRSREVERLERQLARSDSVGEMASLRSRKRFLRFEGKSRAVLDAEKIAEDERWDGLSAVYTDDRELEAEEALAHYHGLWRVEESFRVVKHDLRVRPVFHWTEGRIRAHIAICFMAFACVRHLAYRVAARKERMSPERIRKALLKRSLIVSRCLETGQRYAMPSKPGADTKTVYAAMDLPLNMAPFKIP